MSGQPCTAFRATSPTHLCVLVLIVLLAAPPPRRRIALGGQRPPAALLPADLCRCHRRNLGAQRGCPLDGCLDSRLWMRVAWRAGDRCCTNCQLSRALRFNPDRLDAHNAANYTRLQLGHKLLAVSVHSSRPPRVKKVHANCTRLQLGHKLLGEGAADLLPRHPQLRGVQVNGVELRAGSKYRG